MGVSAKAGIGGSAAAVGSRLRGSGSTGGARWPRPVGILPRIEKMVSRAGVRRRVDSSKLAGALQGLTEANPVPVLQETEYISFRPATRSKAAVRIGLRADEKRRRFFRMERAAGLEASSRGFEFRARDVPYGFGQRKRRLDSDFVVQPRAPRTFPATLSFGCPLSEARWR